MTLQYAFKVYEIIEGITNQDGQPVATEAHVYSTGNFMQDYLLACGKALELNTQLQVCQILLHIDGEHFLLTDLDEHKRAECIKLVNKLIHIYLMGSATFVACP